MNAEAIEALARLLLTAKTGASAYGVSKDDKLWLQCVAMARQYLGRYAADIGYVILRPEGGGLDFVDCTPTVSRTIEEAQEQLTSWYGDIPGAAVYRLVHADPAQSDETSSRLAAAWDEGHEAGFWNGRLSSNDAEALTGIEHAKANNPYRSPTQERGAV